MEIVDALTESIAKEVGDVDTFPRSATHSARRWRRSFTGTSMEPTSGRWPRSTECPIPPHGKRSSVCAKDVPRPQKPHRAVFSDSWGNYTAWALRRACAVHERFMNAIFKPDDDRDALSWVASFFFARIHWKNLSNSIPKNWTGGFLPFEAWKVFCSIPFMTSLQTCRTGLFLFLRLDLSAA